MRMECNVLPEVDRESIWAISNRIQECNSRKTRSGMREVSGEELMEGGVCRGTERRLVGLKLYRLIQQRCTGLLIPLRSKCHLPIHHRL